MDLESVVKILFTKMIVIQKTMINLKANYIPENCMIYYDYILNKIYEIYDLLQGKNCSHVVEAMY